MIEPTQNVLGVDYRDGQTLTADVLSRDQTARRLQLERHLHKVHGESDFVVTRGCVIRPSRSIDGAPTVEITAGEVRRNVDHTTQEFAGCDSMKLPLKFAEPMGSGVTCWYISLLLHVLPTDEISHGPRLKIEPIFGIRENAILLAIVCKRKDHALLVDNSVRYTTTMGQQIQSTTETATIYLSATADDPLHRFSLRHHRDGTTAPLETCLSIDSNTRTLVRGTSHLAGDLWLSPTLVQNPGEESSLQFGAITAPSQGVKPCPWSLRTQETRNAPSSSIQMFQVELENPGPDAELGRYQFCIGAPSVVKGHSRFRSILTATPERKVYIYGAPPIKSPGEQQAASAEQAPSGDTMTLVVRGGVIREKAIQPTLSDPLFAQRVFRETVAGELVIEFGNATVTTRRDDGRTESYLTYSFQIKNCGEADLSAVQVFQSIYETPTERDLPDDNRIFAIRFDKLSKIKPDRDLQRKVCDYPFLRSHAEAPSATTNVSLPSSIVKRNLTISLLVFGTAAVGSLVYAIRSRTVGVTSL